MIPRPLGLLIFAIIFLTGGIYELLPTFTSHSELVPISGHLEMSEVVYIPNQSKRKPTMYSAVLRFKLKEHSDTFRLTDDEQTGFMTPEYDSLLRVIDSSVLYTVHLDEDDLGDRFAKIYQIDINDKTILDFEQSRTAHLTLAICLIVFGTGLFLGYLYTRSR